MPVIVKSYKIKLLTRVILLAATFGLLAWLILKNYSALAVVVGAIAVMEIYYLYRLCTRLYTELEEFVESIRHHDFSRHFNVKKAPADLQPLRKGFNDINAAFKDISKEKETQFHYLQTMLEMVNTGILSYNEETGDIVWMNESLKKMLRLPYLRTLPLLEKRNRSLYHHITDLKPGTGNVVNVDIDKDAIKLMLSATIFQTDGQHYKLVAFQNINEALDETEAKAWQKLLSVMTHEIMNSVAPISSLAKTLQLRLAESMPQLENREGSVDDLELGIATIQRRSEGLLKFAETYRQLNKITNLTVQEMPVRDLFEHLLQLMQPSLDQKNIEAEMILQDMGLRLRVDKHLIEQVLINLLVNAIEAVKDVSEPRITLSAYRNTDNKIIIQVTDNGAGIPAEIMEKIFIPFFSTRKTGSGIGLSLCRQIMLLHKGNIFVRSEPGMGSSFLLQF